MLQIIDQYWKVWAFNMFRSRGICIKIRKDVIEKINNRVRLLLAKLWAGKDVLLLRGSYNKKLSYCRYTIRNVDSIVVGPTETFTKLMDGKLYCSPVDLLMVT